MALAKDRVQACSFYGNVYGGPSVQVPDPSLGFLNHHKAAMLEEVESSENTSGSDSVKNFSISRLPSLSGPSNGNSTGFVFGATNSPPEEVLSIINFKTGYDHLVCPSESFLSFEQGELVSQNDYSIWADAMDKNNHWNGVNPKCVTDSRLSEDLNCFEVASGYGLMDTTAKDNQHREERFGWLCKGAVDVIEGVQQSEGPEACSQKRPYMGDNMQALKKHCTGAPRKANKANSTPSNDPQSIAAKNRRERISERLKVLQDLVPNGTKVDLVTMLEKAISYVKFLQLQVKVLATDEFWPVQGGKAPEVAQVKEAIDAILSSNRDRNSRPM